jgi:gluconokinase
VIVYLFGLAGAGKSWTGDVLERRFGFFRYEADADLTQEMRDSIASKQNMTIPMLDRYFEIIADRIVALASIHENLVVTQATYRERHREYLRGRLPDMILIHVAAPWETIVERLSANRLVVDVSYAEQMLPYFEDPKQLVIRFENTGSEYEAVQQLSQLLKTRIP